MAMVDAGRTIAQQLKKMVHRYKEIRGVPEPLDPTAEQQEVLDKYKACIARLTSIEGEFNTVAVAILLLP